MKTSAAFITSALLATTALAAPEPEAWRDWRKNGHKGGWNKPACPGDKDKSPIPFTSTYSVVATPDQVVDTDNQYTGGLPGAKGYYDFGINSDLNLICYYIKLQNFRGEYESAANTATHVHEAPKGEAGPPRLAFPNPVGDDKERISVGCLQGPFATGIEDDNGVDTGANFHVSQIEADPAAFFADVHSSLAVPGAVRGQIA